MKDLWSRLHGIAVSRTKPQLAALVVMPVAAVAVLWWLLRPPAAPTEAGLPMVAGAATEHAAGAPTSSAAPPPVGIPTETVATVVVQIAGAVARPGVYELAGGSRVVDLVDAAGGALRDADPQAMALASVLVDGQRVVVPRIGEVLAPADLGATGSASGAAVPAGPINLNTASSEDLDALPGVGPAIAAAIVAHRDDEGPFRTVSDLLDVPGIGPAKLAAIEDLVTV